MGKRKYHLDILRIMAILMVLFIHSTFDNNGYLKFINETGFNYYIDLSFSTISKIGVPIFYTISGALLLNKEESYKKVFLNRFLKFLLLICVVNTVYYLRDVYLIRHVAFNLSELLYNVYHVSKYPESIWYLYSYLSFLVMLPLLRKLVRNMDKNDFTYFFIVCLVLKGIIPFVSTLVFGYEVTLNPSFNSLLFISEVIIFPILGYYLENYVDISKNNIYLNIVCFVTSILITVLFVKHYCVDLIASTNIYDYEEMMGIFNLVSVASLYLLVKDFSKNIKENKILAMLSSTVLGIYLIEPILTYETLKFYDLIGYCVQSNIQVIVWNFINFIIGSIVVYIFLFLKNKLLRK